jgi:HD-GYP domain-containing protein (c-di-GMP phosphodiesterase class II)
MKERIEIADLTIGMFVAELDRPWLDTPFLLQGFLIESQQDIDELRKYCSFVYVEPEQSTGEAYRPPPQDTDESQRKRAPAPEAPPALAAKVEAEGGSLWETIKRILRAAFGGEAAGSIRPAPRPAQVPAGERSSGGGLEGWQTTRRTPSAMSAIELDYLAPEPRLQGRGGGAIYGDESGVRGPTWLAIIRSWFGIGARLRAGRREEDTAAEPDMPPPVYPDATTFEEELPKANEAHQQAKRVIDQMVEDIRANKTIEVRKVQEAVLSMVESVVRNANSFMWLARLKERDAATYDHGLNVAVFLLCFGRHLGLPKGLLEILGTAGLMQDVGKLKLPASLLNRRTPLNATERETLRTHVRHSVEILESLHNASPVLLEIVAQHHERFDGSGYPSGLKGDEISMLGAMAGIVDTYAAMTSNRPYRDAILPQEVLRQMYGWRGKLFNSELVEKFIQCVGIFPVGSLVELNTREVAIVMAHSQVRRLKPRLMLILDNNQQPYRTPIVLDLLSEPTTPAGEPYRIVRGLQPDTHDIDLYQRVSATAAPHLLSSV